MPFSWHHWFTGRPLCFAIWMVSSHCCSRTAITFSSMGASFEFFECFQRAPKILNGYSPVENILSWREGAAQVVLSVGGYESSAKGDGLGGTETISGIQFTLDSDGGGVDQNGIYYDADNIEYIRKHAEGQAERDAADKARSE